MAEKVAKRITRRRGSQQRVNLNRIVSWSGRMEENPFDSWGDFESVAVNSFRARMLT